ncbi:MAG: hypothetical protein WD182_02705, partial [Bacteroidota bacterium]
IRPASMGGGNGAYNDSKGGTAFTIPSKMSSNENATYAPTIDDADNVTIVATSAQDASNTVTATIDLNGKLGTWVYAGAFL